MSEESKYITKKDKEDKKEYITKKKKYITKKKKSKWITIKEKDKGLAGGGAATHGLGRAFMKGGRAQI